MENGPLMRGRSTNFVSFAALGMERWKGLWHFGLDLTNWDVIRKEFLKDYKRNFTAKTICANFKGLQQKPLKAVHDYWAKVCGIFLKMYEAALEKMGHISTRTPSKT